MGGCFRSWLGNLGKKKLTNIAILLARGNLPRLVSSLTINTITKFERKKVEKELWEQEKDLLYSNYIIKIIKSLEDWDVLIDGVTETVNHEIKKQEGGFLGDLLASLAALLLQPVIFAVVKGIIGRRDKRVGWEHMDQNF